MSQVFVAVPLSQIHCPAACQIVFVVSHIRQRVFVPWEAQDEKIDATPLT